MIERKFSLTAVFHSIERQPRALSALSYSTFRVACVYQFASGILNSPAQTQSALIVSTEQVCFGGVKCFAQVHFRSNC